NDTSPHLAFNHVATKLLTIHIIQTGLRGQNTLQFKLLLLWRHSQDIENRRNIPPLLLEILPDGDKGLSALCGVSLERKASIASHLLRLLLQLQRRLFILLRHD